MIIFSAVICLFGGNVAASECPFDISCTYGYHEDRTPTHGYEPTREAAMLAFAKSWHRET
jgi:hypothetical protein